MCQVRPIRSASAGSRTTPAAVDTIDFGPSAPTTTRASIGAGSPATETRAGPSPPSPNETPRTAAPRRTVAPAASARSSRAGSRADRSKPTAVGPPASAPYVSRNAVPRGDSTRIAGIDRATRAMTAASSPARRSSRTAAGDANTPPARQCHAGERSTTSTS